MSPQYLGNLGGIEKRQWLDTATNSKNARWRDCYPFADETGGAVNSRLIVCVDYDKIAEESDTLRKPSAQAQSPIQPECVLARLVTPVRTWLEVSR